MKRRLFAAAALCAAAIGCAPAGAQEIPKDFHGLWGDAEACKASKSGAGGDYIAFSVSARKFADHGISCVPTSVTAAGSKAVTVRADCVEEGGNDEGDDGKRIVTMRLVKPKQLALRFQHARKNPQIPADAQDASTTVAACP